MFALFLTSEISPLHIVSKRFTKTFNGDFRPFLPPGNILKGDRFVDKSFLYVSTKSWNILKVKSQGSKVKRIRLYHCITDVISDLVCVSSPFLWMSMGRLTKQTCWASRLTVSKAGVAWVQNVKSLVCFCKQSKDRRCVKFPRAFNEGVVAPPRKLFPIANWTKVSLRATHDWRN